MYKKCMKYVINEIWLDVYNVIESEGIWYNKDSGGFGFVIDD